jgi:hypothetical protein
MVFTIGVVSITGLAGSKVGSTVSIFNTIVVVVGWDSVRVSRLSTVSWSWGISWCWSILGSSGGNSHKSKESNKGL